MKERLLQMKVFYEIAMSIGNSLHLKKMIREGLSVYLRKLNCSAGLILYEKEHQDGEYGLAPLYAIPRNAVRNRAVRAALGAMPERKDAGFTTFLNSLPLDGREGEDLFFTIQELPGFGYLIMAKSGVALDPIVIQSLKPLNEKLAKALIACLQNETIEKYNQKLKDEITVRKDTEKELRDSEEKYRRLFENAPLGIISMDREGRVIDINQESLDILGAPSKEEVLSINALDYPPLIESGISNNVRRCLRFEEAGVYETKYMSKWNRKAHVRYHLNPIKNNGDRLMGAQAVVEDISSTKQLEEQLQHAQKMEAIGTLAGGISHDFNNLLMAIQGNVSLMLIDLERTHPHYKRLKNIETQVKSGTKLTGQLLGYARKGQYELRAIDLNKTIEEMSEAFGRAKKEVRIGKDLEDSLYTIDADQNQMEQVMLNLFVNASDAMPKRRKPSSKNKEHGPG